MDSRSIITGLLGLAFIASHNLYLYVIEHNLLDITYYRGWYSAELVLFVMPLLLMGNSNIKSQREIQFRCIVYIAVSIVMAIIVLNTFNLIPLPHLQVYYFNGITFAYTLYALLFSDKNGNF